MSQPIATLSYVDNGLGGVNFVLTNTIGNLFPADTSAFLSQLFFNVASSPLSISNLSANINSLTLGGVTNSSLQFDLQAQFPVSGNPGNLHINHGEFASWTFNGFTEASVLLPAMVHIQATAFNDGSVKVTGSIPTTPESVPEPGLLLLLGSGLLGLGMRGKVGA